MLAEAKGGSEQLVIRADLVKGQSGKSPYQVCEERRSKVDGIEAACGPSG